MMSNDPYFGYYKDKRPEEYIEFGGFNSRSLGYVLTERSNPLPAEKRILENIPFSDGVQDYSQILGKFFEERTINYTLVKLKATYEERKKLELLSKQLASAYDYMPLIDTHDRGYYWKAKLQTMTFTDDATTSTLTLALSFIAQPYMYQASERFHDVWDSFHFEKDVAQFYLFDTRRTKQALIIIPDKQKTEPTFELLSGSVTVTVNRYKHKLKKGKNATPFIVFNQEKNYIQFEGQGIVRVIYDIGVMG